MAEHIQEQWRPHYQLPWTKPNISKYFYFPVRLFTNKHFTNKHSLSQIKTYFKIPGEDRVTGTPEFSMTHIVFYVLGLDNIKALLSDASFHM